MTNNITTANIPQTINNIEVNTNAAEALTLLSNLKKYKVDILCIENLKETGWNMIGDKLEGERRGATTVKVRERKQIDEAVQYYVPNQKIRRNRQSEMISTTNKKMKWEIDAKNILNNSCFCVSL